MTLLWELSSHRGFELAVDGAGYVALEAAADLSVGVSFGAASGDVGLDVEVSGHPGADDDVEGAVELTVA